MKVLLFYGLKDGISKEIQDKTNWKNTEFHYLYRKIQFGKKW